MSTLESFKIDFIFPNMSFLTGMGSALNIAGNYYKFKDSESPEEADYKAIQSDWAFVGRDLNEAIKEYRDKINHK